MGCLSESDLAIYGGHRGKQGERKRAGIWWLVEDNWLGLTSYYDM